MNATKTKEEIRREVEKKKLQWEENVNKINEERERKERERLKAIEQKKREEMQRRLEESRAKSLKLLEEEQKMWAQTRSELSETMDVIDNQTDYNLLESMINKDADEKGAVSDELSKIMEHRTVPMTPLILNELGNQTDDGKARIEALLDASIRTERTIVVQIEDERVVEERKRHDKNVDMDTLDIEYTP